MKDKKEIIMTYIKENVAPILVDFIFGEDILNSVVLSSNCDLEDLNGHYEETEYVAPKWYYELQLKETPILVIDRIDNIKKEEQVKFIEILKYRKISTFELPKETRIILTANNVNKDTINEEIYSLVADLKVKL